MDSKFISFPDNRFLDLNLRTIHILAALIQICFARSTGDSSSVSLVSGEQRETKLEIQNDESYEERVKAIVLSIQSLLPIDDKNLLTSLIDIIALTKFSPEIVLSLSDHSVSYALSYYEKNLKEKQKEYVRLMDKDLDQWKLKWDSSAKGSLAPISHSIKFSVLNKVVNFLLSIGFEVVGNWLRFNDTDFYRRIIDLMLKFLTSFAQDRDMSLYGELNINVLGQRSAPAKSKYDLIRSPTYLNNENKKSVEDSFKVRRISSFKFKIKKYIFFSFKEFISEALVQLCRDQKRDGH